MSVAVAGDVGDHQTVCGLAALAERPHAQPQPARRLAAAQARDAHFLLQAAAFARRLDETVDRLRDLGVAEEDALDRPHVVGADRVRQPQIGGVGVDHPAARIRHHNAVARPVDHRLEGRAAAIPAGDPQNAGRSREQRKDADHAEDGEQRQHIGLGLIAADKHQPDRGGDQHDGHEQHQPDAAPPFAGCPVAHVVFRHPGFAIRAAKPPALSVPESGRSPQGAGVAAAALTPGLCMISEKAGPRPDSASEDFADTGRKRKTDRDWRAESARISSAPGFAAPPH